MSAAACSGYRKRPVIALHLFNAVIILRHFGSLTAAERLGFASYLLLPMVANAMQVAMFGVAL